MAGLTMVVTFSDNGFKIETTVTPDHTSPAATPLRTYPHRGNRSIPVSSTAAESFAAGDFGASADWHDDSARCGYITSEENACKNPIASRMSMDVCGTPIFCDLHECNHMSRCSRRDYEHMRDCHSYTDADQA
jgi:hypothetical protein